MLSSVSTLRSVRHFRLLGATTVTIVAGYALALLLGPDPRSFGALGALYDLLCTAILFLLMYGVGSRFLRMLKPAVIEPRDHTIFAFGLGAALVSLGVLLLGLFPAYKAEVVVPAALVAMLLVRDELDGLFAPLYRVARGDGTAKNTLNLFTTAILSTLAIVLLITAAAPETSYDALVYHVSVPQQYVDAGRLTQIPHNAHASLVAMTQFLYVPLLAVGASSAPALVSFGFAVLLGLAVWSAADLLFGRIAATFSLLTLWSTTIILFGASRASVDVVLTFYVFTATHAALLALRRPVLSGALDVSALLLGCACAVKYHGFVWTVAVAPLLMIAAWNVAGRPGPAARKLSTMMLLGLVACAPWLLKNRLLFGAPLYPYFSELQMPSWLAPLAPEDLIPGAIAAEIAITFDRMREPFNLRDLFLAPWRITPDIEAVLYYMNPLLLLVPAALSQIRRRDWLWVLYPPCAYLVLLVVPFPRTSIRYIMPAIPGLSILACALVVRVVDRFVAERVRNVVLIVIGCLALYGPAVAATGILNIRQPDVYLDPRASVADYYQAVSPGLIDIRTLLIEHVAIHDTVLFVFEARWPAVPMTILQDDVLLNWPLLLGVVGQDGCLAVSQPRFILVNVNGPYYWSMRGLQPTDLHWEEFQRYALQCLELRASRNGVFLYESTGKWTADYRSLSRASKDQ